MQKNTGIIADWGDPYGNSSLLGDGRIRGVLSQGIYDLWISNHNGNISYCILYININWFQTQRQN